MKECSKCGEEKELSSFPYDCRKTGRVKAACKKCSQAMTRVWKINNTARWLWLSAKHRAKRFGRDFNITVEDIENVMPPSRICKITGAVMVVGNRMKGDSPSLDRLDSSLGYAPGNIQVISHRANATKNNK